ncbi:peroxisomal multifunctional enzyme type 2 [Hyalangium rubrum]|uniref:SDR family NAD(P)-dependent oxidoreductase n=1 Tax=Hyalangium rubrum TaxID=3103134 RepID=A0ABU5HG93_9BACT|nr:SDR family NAD(P)-dependent oxidoreductase [Hyalangium sp. s54d21]MDY7232472.1 SDR family NAD(P)-dependent oxidoreductase [Hyalangium sp. s54d21]
MANELRFDGRVAIVTGAGQGLGRSHALLLASRGAKVVVNDLGGSSTGGGKSSEAADKVVAEIKAAGGEAVANYDSVEEGAKIVQAALDHFKRVDIVINNAGILRDTSFHKMSEQDWELIYRVHLLGAFRVTHAAWPHMREAGYGRVLFTSSAAGIYGNFGQANYSMAKLGLVGFARTLAAEGSKKNILVNVIAPIAGSRLTETILPKEVTEALKPEYVSPLVAVLAHESCQENGGLFEVGGGFMAKLRWQRTEGVSFKLGRNVTPDLVQGSWQRITDFEKATYPEDVTSAMQPVMDNLGSKSRGGNELIDVDAALGYEFPPTTSAYDERDLALYALGVGAARDPLDAKELRYVYENHGEGFMPLPTYAVIPAVNSVLKLMAEGKQAPGLNYGLDRVLHGEQYTELLRPLPPHAKLRHKGRIKDIFDKGKNALVVTDIRTFNADTGEELVRNELTVFVRGAGGWGGDRGPSSDINVPPERAPDEVITEKTNENQALLYRLSGDWNPLHADPSFASAFGFPKPILHGLCTFGHAARHVLKAFREGDARFFKSIKVRFAESVFPGETLRTEMWRESPTRIVFRCRVLERDKVVISNAAIELHTELPKAAPAPQAAAESKPAAASGQGSASAQVFAAIRSHVDKHPELVGKVAHVYLFKLTQPDSAWTLDLKNGQGSVTQGAVGKADCTLELTDADFLAMTSGKADPQKLYFGGKLKIAGNVMASQKLNFLQKIDPKEASASAAPAPVSSKPAGEAPNMGAASAPAIFQALQERLAKSPDQAAGVGALLQFKLTSPEGAWVVDLRTAPGSVKQGTVAEPAATLTLADEELLALVKAPESARELYMKGKLRVDGDTRVAQRLGFLKNLV